jgi:hypothetical protein
VHPRSRISASTWTGAEGYEPYQASIAASGHGWALALTGCGDGSAQLVPAERLLPFVEVAVRGASGTPTQRLEQMLLRIDAGTQALSHDELLKGASADGVLATWDEEHVCVGHCGLSTPLGLSAAGLTELLEPETVAVRARRRGVPPTKGWENIVARRFGTGQREPFEHTCLPWRELDAVVLATHEVWATPGVRTPSPLRVRAAWARESMSDFHPARLLAAHARTHMTDIGGRGAGQRFQARAAIAVLRVQPFGM